MTVGGTTDAFVTTFADADPCEEAYCGDGVVNQEWEQCDTEEGCNDQCQEDDQCSELVFGRINITDVTDDVTEDGSNPPADDDGFWNKPGGDGDMTGDTYVGGNTLADIVPNNTWFLLHDGTDWVNDPVPHSAYRDVPGLSVQRRDGETRVTMYASHDADGLHLEHVEGTFEVFNSSITSHVTDISSASELSVDGIKKVKHDGDELWMDSGDAYFFMTAGGDNDSFIVGYDEAESCDEPEDGGGEEGGCQGDECEPGPGGGGSGGGSGGGGGGSSSSSSGGSGGGEVLGASTDAVDGEVLAATGTGFYSYTLLALAILGFLIATRRQKVLKIKKVLI